MARKEPSQSDRLNTPDAAALMGCTTTQLLEAADSGKDTGFPQPDSAGLWSKTELTRFQAEAARDLDVAEEPHGEEPTPPPEPKSDHILYRSVTVPLGADYLTPKSPLTVNFNLGMLSYADTARMKKIVAGLEHENASYYEEQTKKVVYVSNGQSMIKYLLRLITDQLDSRSPAATE